MKAIYQPLPFMKKMLPALGLALCAALPSACSDSEELTTPPPTADEVSPNETFLTDGEVLFFCDFQDIEVSNRLFKAYDLSGLTPAANAKSVGFSPEKPWLLKLMDDLTSTNFYAGSHSWFDPAGTANAWLVSQRIDIPAEGYTLSWKSESGFVQLLDQLSVHISTTGPQPETDFTEPAIWETDAEPAGATDGILDGEWNEHSISLDRYAGQSIWIAFVNQSHNKGILCIDDVRVAFDAPYHLTNHTPRLSVDNLVGVKGELTAGNTPIVNPRVHYSADGQTVSTLRFDNVTLQPGQSLKFAFPDSIRLTRLGEYQSYRLWAGADSTERIGVKDSVGFAALLPQPHAVLEEGTGTWCGNCPLGTLAIDYLSERYGEQFIPIAVHNDDPMTVQAYNDALAFTAFPMGTVNRQRYSMPIHQRGENYSFEGDNTFLHDVEEELAKTPLWEPRIVQTQWSDNELYVQSETRFALHLNNRSFCIAYVLTENNVDQVNSPQSNYFYNYTNTFFGEYSKGGKYGQKYIVDYAFQDVARGIFPAFRGEKAPFPQTLQAGTAYSHELTIDLSRVELEDANELYVTMLLIDDADGCILNAHRVKAK